MFKHFGIETEISWGNVFDTMKGDDFGLCNYGTEYVW